jgi:eukaryotic-like serine/threonine-protein kinase
MFIESLSGKDSTTQYSQIDFFAKGGMGEIYKAYDNINQKEVAIKFIHITNQSEEELLIREVDVSSKLDGKNVVKTNYTGKEIINSQSYLYIVQEFYSNGNLRNLLSNSFSLDDCFNMMNDILLGLQIAHKIIVHRDLKPENILIDSSGSLVLTDFGLAKYIDDKTRTKTFKGAGTIPYMAPECWLLDTNSISMDIYSSGIIFYELLTGKLPSESRTEKDWRDFHLYQQLPDITALRPDVPIKLKQIIAKMTQKRSQERYKNVDEIISALNDAFEQTKQDRKEVERLAAIGHSTVQKILQKQLMEKQKLDEINEYKKFINYHITDLFEKIKSLGNSINTTMELNKIHIEEHPYNGDLACRKLIISFNDKKVSLKFYNQDVIKNYEKERLEEHIAYQKRQHGHFFNSLDKSIFQLKNIIYLGIVEADFKNIFNQEKFGYNLTLVKNEADLYGAWYVASFSDSGFSRSDRKNFALDLPYFLKDFGLSFITHILSVDYHALNDKDISNIIEEIL